MLLLIKRSISGMTLLLMDTTALKAFKDYRLGSRMNALRFRPEALYALNPTSKTLIANPEARGLLGGGEVFKYS